jgi:hypothetical protein
MVRNIVINKGHKEYEIIPYSGSGYEPYNGEYGRFQAKVIFKMYDNEDYNVMRYREYNHWFYFDSNRNLYLTKNSKEIFGKL